MNQTGKETQDGDALRMVVGDTVTKFVSFVFCFFKLAVCGS